MLGRTWEQTWVHSLGMSAVSLQHKSLKKMTGEY